MTIDLEENGHCSLIYNNTIQTFILKIALGWGPRAKDWVLQRSENEHLLEHLNFISLKLHRQQKSSTSRKA